MVSFSMTILVERWGGEGEREEWVGERVRERVGRRLWPRLLLRLRLRERDGVREGAELREVLRGVGERVGERRPLGRSAMSVSAMMVGGAWGGEDADGWVERVAKWVGRGDALSRVGMGSLLQSHDLAPEVLYECR